MSEDADRPAGGAPDRDGYGGRDATDVGESRTGSATPPCCSDVAAQLWEFLDRELTAGSAAGIEEHLARCQRCYPLFDFQRAYRELLRRQSVCSVPPGLRSRVFRALLEEAAGRPLR
jgi:anti-sigma factor (TIGR02949 family)